MRLTRLFVSAELQTGQQILLDSDRSHYLVNVLRLRVDTPLIIFNGQGGEYHATVAEIKKKQAYLTIERFDPISRESTLRLHLVQAISKPEHMDYAIQKAVELGVTHITPLLTKRSPPLAKNRFEKREQHWQKIIQNACEQCGRTVLPSIGNIISFDKWIDQNPAQNSVFFMPHAEQNLTQSVTPEETIQLIIGAEGGFSDEEIALLTQKGHQAAHLGARILRTETAAVTVLSLCQGFWGDLN
ncbi:16S rRNA (uracil(1498)-N(3))-methyltransferase [Candidatus Albibeggiatoa sp. nov. NOAA]|uniref:16S rRNA (uracil(1498)-N(3))-methyltransferase n=1 Tax=Candidatus Albibeggiatoa sp. nov. NOAA TaxID=3162724 RepID=UPI003300F8B5|nr:16S rRNA (uracil(1498)-N(3))-methyltransferase [Thiotrichaceae bacterium]